MYVCPYLGTITFMYVLLCAYTHTYICILIAVAHKALPTNVLPLTSQLRRLIVVEAFLMLVGSSFLHLLSVFVFLFLLLFAASSIPFDFVYVRKEVAAIVSLYWCRVVVAAVVLVCCFVVSLLHCERKRSPLI